MNWRTVSLIDIFIIGLLVFSALNASGKIPEPDNVVYGVAREGSITVIAKVDGREIASFNVSNQPESAPYYILRLPIDSFEPQNAGTTRPGDLAEIYINGENTAAASLIVGEKGEVTKLHLSTTDSDDDGILDSWEIFYFGSLTASDGSGDSDNDGLSDLEEFQRDSSPVNGNDLVSEPNISTDFTTLAFGTVVIDGGSSTKVLTVTNLGTADLVIGSLTIGGFDAAAFSLANDSCSSETIAPSASRTVHIIFDALSAGTAQATLTIPSNDPDSSNLIVTLTGTGEGNNIVYVCNDDDCDCGANLPCYDTITAGYGAVSNDGLINVSSGFYLENLTFAEDIVLTLSGGWNADYNDNSGNHSTIGGSLVITEGTVVIEGIVIEGTTSVAKAVKSGVGCWTPEFRQQRWSLLR